MNVTDSWGVAAAVPETNVTVAMMKVVACFIAPVRITFLRRQNKYHYNSFRGIAGESIEHLSQ
jgi:hypothetical protein